MSLAAFTAALVFLAAVVYFVVAPKGREQGLEMYHDDRAAELERALEVIALTGRPFSATAPTMPDW